MTSQPSENPTGTASVPPLSSPAGTQPGPRFDPRSGAPFGSGPTGPTPPPSDPFDKIRALGIVRPDEGRWFAGVAAGLARRWGVDPILVRGGFVALSLLFGAGVFVYGIAWLLLPHPDGRIHAQEVTRGQVTAGFIGSVITILAGMPAGNAWSRGSGWTEGSGLIALVIVGGLIWWFTRRHRQVPGRGGPVPPTAPPASPGTFPGAAPGAAPGAFPGAFPGTASQGPTSAYEPGVGGGFGTPEAGMTSGPAPASGPSAAATTFTSSATAAATSTVAPPPPHPAVALRRATRPLRALTLATLGTALLTGVLVAQFSDNGAVVTASALGVIGLGLVIAGLAGRRGGFLGPVGVVLALVTLAGLSSPDYSSTPDQRWTPTTASAATDGFRTGAASSEIDLTSPALIAAARAGALDIPIDQGAGELRLLVPAGVPVEVDVSVGAGEIQDDVTNRTEQGLGNRMTVRSGEGTPVMTVDLSLGAGRVVVEQRAVSAAIPSPSVPSPIPSSVPSSAPSPVPSR